MKLKECLDFEKNSCALTFLVIPEVFGPEWSALAVECNDCPRQN